MDDEKEKRRGQSSLIIALFIEFRAGHHLSNHSTPPSSFFSFFCFEETCGHGLHGINAIATIQSNTVLLTAFSFSFSFSFIL
jgi:hypothetical protein